LLVNAFNIPIRTKNTAIPFFGLQPCCTMAALIKILTRIGGHGFFFFKTACRAFDDGF